VIFPFAVVEGPILTVLTGFVASLGYLNPFVAYGVILAGDVVGDSVLYLLGRSANNRISLRILKFLKIAPAHLLVVKEQIERHPKKILLASKFLYGAGGIGLVAAGFSRFSFRRYVLINLLGSAFQALILILIGYYFGQAYTSIKTYIDYWAVIGSVIFMVGYFLLFRYFKKTIK
jgi:membrane protein DedA with SNARE-associated domain